jgi:hypothetical protein
MCAFTDARAPHFATEPARLPVTTAGHRPLRSAARQKILEMKVNSLQRGETNCRLNAD